MGCLLIDKAETLDSVTLVNGTTELLANMDVSKINVISIGALHDLKDRIDCYGGEEVRVMGDNLGVNVSDSVLDGRESCGQSSRRASKFRQGLP